MIPALNNRGTRENTWWTRLCRTTLSLAYKLWLHDYWQGCPQGGGQHTQFRKHSSESMWLGKRPQMVLSRSDGTQLQQKWIPHPEPHILKDDFLNTLYNQTQETMGLWDSSVVKRQADYLRLSPTTTHREKEKVVLWHHTYTMHVCVLHKHAK